MEFSALAAKETSALLTRALGKASEASLQRVDALRATLDAASKALEAAIVAPPDVERDVDELVGRLTKAAAAEADARLKHLSAEARKITDALRAELGEVTGEKEALAISLKDSRAQLDTVRSQLTVEQKQVQASQKVLQSLTLRPGISRQPRADAIVRSRKGSGGASRRRHRGPALRTHALDPRAKIEARAAEAAAAASRNSG